MHANLSYKINHVTCIDRSSHLTLGFNGILVKKTRQWTPNHLCGTVIMVFAIYFHLIYRKDYTLSRYNLLVILTIFFCHFAYGESLTPARDPIITPELIELLKITDVKCKHTLSAIVQATQKSWLRPAGKERWEID